LYRYLGNRTLKSFKEIEKIAQENITVVNMGEIPMELDKNAKLKGSNHNKEPILPPSTILHSAHVDIGFGDSTAPGGIKYILLIVDRKSQYCWTYPLKGISGKHLKAAFMKFKIDAGTLPKHLYTDFDKKLIKGKCKEYLVENEVRVAAAPSGRQNQNGLVERAWQTICNMGRAFLTDMRMPKSFWYWAL
jgi:hypothetical protein